MRYIVIVMCVLGVLAIIAWSWVLPGLSPVNATAHGDAGTLRRWMMGLVTAVVLCTSLFVILKKDQDEGTKKWAFGAVGTIMGFWLKQE